MVYSLSRCPLVLSILPLLLLFTTSLSLSAQQLEHLAERPVGFAPGQLVVDPTTGMVHLLTNGQDTDFDGQLDSGEVSPAWYILDSKGVPIDSVIFAAHYNSFPTRVAFDFDGSHMWVLVGGELRSFDARTMAIIDTTVGIADMNGQGIAVPSLGSAVWDPGQGLLYLTKRAEDFVSAGEMIAFEPFDKRVVGRSRSGVNPNGGVGGVEVSALGLSRTWILNEGQANERNASLGLVGIAPDIYTAVNSGPLFPGGVERAAVFGDVAWLLVPRTREIVGIDRRSHLMQPASSFKLGDTVIPLALDADADRVTVVAAVDERRYLYIHDRTTGMLRPRLTLPTGTDRIATGGAEIYTLASPRGPDGGSDSVTIIDQPGAQNVTSLYAGPKPSNLWMRHDDEELVVVGNASQAGPAWYQRFEAETHDVIASGPIPVGGFQGDQSALDDDRGVLGFLFQGEGSLAISYLGELDLASGEIDTVWSALGYFPHRIAYGDGVWYLTNFPGDFVPEPTILVAVETESGEELSRSVVGESAPAIAIPSFSSVEGAHAVYTMATGGYGAAGTEMRYTEHHPNLFEGTLGDLGNHLMYEYFDCLGEDLAVVTLNNSHTIAIVELLDGAPAITNRVSTDPARPLRLPACQPSSAAPS